MTDRANVGPVSFTVMRLNDAIAAVMRDDHQGRAVHFCNAYNVALASRDADYARLLQRGDLVFSDGVPITWVGKRAYPPMDSEWDRVYGPDVMRGVLARSTSDGPRHYLLGGATDTLVELERRLRAEYPLADIVGVESPPFRPATAGELAERDARITASGANLVWVGLGTPRQDVEVRRLADALPLTALAVGAAFDFLAGTKPQAPSWMQRNGLEWAFRLGSEPRRLGRRYVWGNSVFAAEAVKTLVAAQRKGA